MRTPRNASAWRLLTACLFIATTAGCMITSDRPYYRGNPYYDYGTPTSPTGLYSVTGDGRVTIYWSANYDASVSTYRIYRSTSEGGYYDNIGETSSLHFSDYSVYNGQSYFYALTAVSYDGIESRMSRTILRDTPRPEGYGVDLVPAAMDVNGAGYSFAMERVVPATSADADIVFDLDGSSGEPLIYAATGSVDVQDFGWVSSLQEVDVAPETGWLHGGNVPAVSGHAVVVWTADNHFAQAWLRSVSTSRVTFDWCYQPDPGNPELALPRGITGPRHKDASQASVGTGWRPHTSGRLEVSR